MMDRKRKSGEESVINERMSRPIKFKQNFEVESLRKSKEDMLLSVKSLKSHNSKVSQPLTNIEITLMQRADLSMEYVKASATVTRRRLDDLKKSNAIQSLNTNYPPKDIYKRTIGYDKKENRRDGNFFEPPRVRRHPRRSELPIKPKRSANLWSVIRNCIGKDLSHVTIPVGFSEPLSMLQRLAEEFEYSYLLDKAVTCNDPHKQLAYISAFVVSAYATSGDRLTKPFNPLFGETYELDRRDDMGWRLISEQVLHTPPTSAQFCESRYWRCWKTFSVATIFRGKYIKVMPVGVSHLSLDSGSIVTWGRVESAVNNVLVGKMWLDNVGEIQVFDYTHNIKCVLTFLPFNAMNKDNQKRVRGVVSDNDGHTLWLLDGKWDSHVEITPVRLIGDELEAVGSPEVIWQVNKTPSDITVFYNFTLFACQLNESEDYVAPTDSRKREDIRMMEDGLWDDADTLKKKLEQKDREDRKKIDYPSEPAWFAESNNPVTNLAFYSFTESYWKAKATGDWSKCPDIFTI